MTEVILIGDSIRMGYEDCVRRELEGRAQVWSPEENGGTSANVLRHLEEWVLSRPADVVHVNCGLHDIVKPFDSGEPETSLEEYSANVRAILSRAQAEADCALVWASTTPVNEDWHHRHKGFDRFEEDVRAYNRAASAVTDELGLPQNDLYSVISQAGRDRLLTGDGVHFTDEGCALLGTAVAGFLAPLLTP